MQAIVLLSLLMCSTHQAKPKPIFPLGKDTTYLNGPLDKDGYVDYEAALNDILGKGVTPEQNANVLLWQAFGPHPMGSKGMAPNYFKRLGISEPPAKGEYFIELESFLKEQAQMDQESIEELLLHKEKLILKPWKNVEHVHLGAWLQANEKPLALIIEASKRAKYFNPLVTHRTETGTNGMLSALLPNVQGCREAAFALMARAMWRTQENQTTLAWQDLLACFRLSRLLTHGTIIEILASAAISGQACTCCLTFLDRAGLSSAQLRSCMRDYESLPHIAPITEAVNYCERFMFLESLQLLRRHGVPFLESITRGGRYQPPTQEAQQILAASDWAPGLRLGNRWYDQLIVGINLPRYADRQAAFAKLLGEVEEYKKAIDAEMSRGGLLSDDANSRANAGEKFGKIMLVVFGTALPRVRVAIDAVEQSQRNLQVAFALAMYRQEQGQYPSKLSDLMPRYLASVPNDLFSDKPLVYIRDGNGYMFYSVGKNGRDDGGRTTGDEDNNDGGDDIRVRMPVPPVKLLRVDE